MFGHPTQGIVIGNHRHDVATQFAELLAQQQIVHAVRHLRAQHSDLRTIIGKGQTGRQVVALREDANGSVDTRAIKAEAIDTEHQTHEERPRFLISMLIQIKNIAAISEHEIGERGDQS